MFPGKVNVVYADILIYKESADLNVGEWMILVQGKDDTRQTAHDKRHTTNGTRQTAHDKRHTTHDTRRTAQSSRLTMNGSGLTTNDPRLTRNGGYFEEVFFICGDND